MNTEFDSLSTKEKGTKEKSTEEKSPIEISTEATDTKELGTREFKYAANSETKALVLIAIFSVIYGITSLPIFSPAIFPETSIKLSLAILTLGAVMTGPKGGFAIGLIGGFITDLFAGWGVWLSWIFASGLVGMLLGCFSGLTNWVTVRDGVFTLKHKLILMAMSVVASSFMFVAGVMDYYLYAEPIKKLIIQCAIAAVTHVAVISTLGIMVVSAYAKRTRALLHPKFVDAADYD